MQKLDFSKNPDGLIPAIAQDWQSGEVLMQGYINREAWEMTLKTGKATYWSRSRKELWVKGATSGHYQIIKQILVDCDLDSVIYKVEALGGVACHLGYRTCFFREILPESGEMRHQEQYPPKGEQ
jgi:phosphoribosyl-AMP cyclohydrolase